MNQKDKQTLIEDISDKIATIEHFMDEGEYDQALSESNKLTYLIQLLINGKKL